MISGHLVEPDDEGLGTFKLWEHRDGPDQNLLHRIFSVFALITHAHAEREDRLLQKRERSVQRVRITRPQEPYSFFDFAPHV
jgi:hypothetical protein